MRSATILLTISAVFISGIGAEAQTSVSPPPVRLNTVYLELGGPLGYYSLNYERRLPVSTNWSLGMSAGVVPALPKAWTDANWGFNGALKAVYQQGKNRFTAGAGYSHFFMVNSNAYGGDDRTYNDNYLFAQLGYNRITKSGFTYGAYWTPLSSVQYEDYMLYWPAVQFGYAF